jgi:hypothetical protein
VYRGHVISPAPAGYAKNSRASALREYKENKGSDQTVYAAGRGIAGELDNGSATRENNEKKRLAMIKLYFLIMHDPFP